MNDNQLFEKNNMAHGEDSLDEEEGREEQEEVIHIIYYDEDYVPMLVKKHHANKSYSKQLSMRAAAPMVFAMMLGVVLAVLYQHSTRGSLVLGRHQDDPHIIMIAKEVLDYDLRLRKCLMSLVEPSNNKE